MAPARTPKTYHHGNLRQALIDEAGRVLENDGADAISFRSLARTLGVSHAAPGHHFNDRSELLAELAADGYAGLANALAAAIEESPPDEWLRTSGEAYIRFGVANPERYRMMFASQLIGEGCPERLTIESTRAYLLLLKTAYQREPLGDHVDYHLGTAELAAWSIVHGAVMLWLDGQLGPDMDEAAFLALADDMLANQLH